MFVKSYFILENFFGFTCNRVVSSNEHFREFNFYLQAMGFVMGDLMYLNYRNKLASSTKNVIKGKY